MIYHTIYTPFGKLPHASRDGVHPLCDRTAEGKLIEPYGPEGNHAAWVGCHRCTKLLPHNAVWSGNK